MMTVNRLNAMLSGTGFEVAKCAQDYGYRYFLFVEDHPAINCCEIIRRDGLKHHKPIGWRTLGEAAAEMLGEVRVPREWHIRRVMMSSDFGVSRQTPILDGHLLAGRIITEGHEYVGEASDGTIVSLGDTSNPEQVERYLRNNPNCSDW